MVYDDKEAVLARIQTILEQLAQEENISLQEIRSSICNAVSYADLSFLPDNCQRITQKNGKLSAEDSILRLIFALL